MVLGDCSAKCNMVLMCYTVSWYNDRTPRQLDRKKTDGF